MKLFARFLAVLTFTLVASALVASPASAAPTSVAVNSDMRACPDLSIEGCKKILYTIPSGSQVSMVCWYDSSWWTGRYSSNRWFVVKYGAREAWVHSSQVVNQTTVGWCGNVTRVMAARNAAHWTGQTHANGTVSAYFSASQWSPGPYGEWSGDCVKLGVAAYRAAGKTITSGSTAYNQYLAYKNQGAIKTGTPPIGALVFYDRTSTNSAGHVAVAVGADHAATTIGVDGQQKKNEIRTTTAAGQGGAYLGWALP